MDMELVARAVVALPSIVKWNMFSKGKIQMPWVQSFGKNCLIKVKDGGTIRLGKETVSRGNLTMRAEKGTLIVGDKCFFNANCSITCMDRIEIGNGCQFANNLVIVDHDHDYKKGWGHYKTAPVKIGSDVWVGANCVILKGTTIGDGCVIAAGSVVSGTIEDHTVYYQKRQQCVKRKEEVSIHD